MSLCCTFAWGSGNWKFTMPVPNSLLEIGGLVRDSTGAAVCNHAPRRLHVRPPSNVMNSRRLTSRCLSCSDRKDSTPRHGRLLHPSSWAERDDRDHAAENFFQGGSPKTGHPTYRARTSLGTRNRF